MNPADPMKSRNVSKQREELIKTLRERFEKHPERHAGIEWTEVRARLEAHPDKLGVLFEMERTGAEPDVVGRDGDGFVFFDCSAQTPKGRTSVCYDREGWESRKEHRPANNAVDMAAEMGVSLLSEEDYRRLQALGEFDTKTSSWVATPAEMRKLGGALFGDSRYGRVFFYHNGAQSYYGSRGFRGSVVV
jgi:hypothetical protein